jgi:hypothetical protein
MAVDIQTSSFGAPWAASVKALTLGAAILLLGISALQAIALPRQLLGGWPWLLGVGLPAAVLLVSACFLIRGYALDPSELRVRRLFWDTRIPLESLQSAWAAPDAMSGSLRLFGNGGLFSLTGLFRNKRLGTYRVFATDPKLAVVLEFPSRKVVVTPDSPELFLNQLRLVCPAASKT